MYTVRYSNKMQHDVKVMQKRGKDVSKLSTIVKLLAQGQELPKKCKDHALTGNYAGYRECHIEPDWLLVYKIENNTLTLILVRTGTHSDLF